MLFLTSFFIAELVFDVVLELFVFLRKLRVDIKLGISNHELVKLFQANIVAGHLLHFRHSLFAKNKQLLKEGINNRIETYKVFRRLSSSTAFAFCFKISFLMRSKRFDFFGLKFTMNRSTASV